MIRRGRLAALTERTVVSTELLRAAPDVISDQTHATVDQELQAGPRSVAVPVRDGAGTVVTAVNIPVHAGRHSAESVRGELRSRRPAAVARAESDLAVAAPRR